MFNFPAICIANGTAILLLSIIVSSSKKSIRHGFFDEKIYFAMVILNILQCIIETVVFFMDGKMVYGYHTLLIVLNAILFINTTIFSYLWTVYADYKLFSDIERIKRIYPFVVIPALLIIIGSLINLVTPVFFEIDKYNIYKRTDLYLIPYVVTYFYLAYGVVLIYSHRRKVNKYLSMPAILFMIPVMIGSLLQFFFYGYSLVWLGVAVGLISLFINVQNESAYVDALSGLFNRQYLNNVLFVCSKRGSTTRVLAGIMLDIDDLKGINDRLGHLVGDDAISAAGKILHSAVGGKGKVCRYGGDEFIILMYINSQKEIMDMIDTIKTQARLFNESEQKPYEINFSIGYSTYEIKQESTDDFLKKVDASLYGDKKRKIRERLISDRRHDF
ncbi:MAG: GGDEF domain-containing protein [Saccharofermentanales bacterium]|jgi:diguanylate cyclase (GGDEF)-like protein